MIKWLKKLVKGSDFVVTKKKISVIALDPRAGKSYGEDIAGLFSDVADISVFSMLDGSAAAAAELLYAVICAMRVEITPHIADCLYTGLSTDTGCFRFSNTTAHTFSVAALCTRAGARIYELNQELFETNTLERLKMQAWIVEHLELLRGGEMAICAIPRAVEEEIGVNEDDMDNISNFPRTVAGVRMAATLRETGDGETKLSVRAVPGCDATAVTVRFGGGGHKGAAGASMKLPLDEAVKAVEAVMSEVN